MKYQLKLIVMHELTLMLNFRELHIPSQDCKQEITAAFFLSYIYSINNLVKHKSGIKNNVGPAGSLAEH